MSAEIPDFQQLRIAALESRRQQDMQRLIERMGGRAFVSPSLREVPLTENRPAIDFGYRLLTGEINLAVFLTGVGFKHLLATVARHIDRQRYLDALSDITTVARGPKTVEAMQQEGLRPTLEVPQPCTWRELLKLLDQQVTLANQVIAIQEYGLTNHWLIAGLEARGAEVVQVPVYQWELPQECGPLEDNIRAMVGGERDMLLVTSAHQVVNLLRTATRLGLDRQLRQAWPRLVVASIGPTTSDMLISCGLEYDLQPSQPKMGQLVQVAAEHGPRLWRAKQQRWLQAGESVAAESAGEPVATGEKPAAGSSTVEGDASSKSGAEAAHGGDSGSPGDEKDPGRPDSSGTAARVLPPEDSPPLPAWLESPFMRACQGLPTKVTPIWLMRQAGRYMAEYREVRRRQSFLELCRNPQLCAEVMATAVERLGVDAAIIFSDLLPILEPMGMQLEFVAGDGPVIHNPLREPVDVDRVVELESMEALWYVPETVRQTRLAIPLEIPIIGFAGAPFTLASYMIEGGSSRQYWQTKQMMYRHPDAWHRLMGKLSRSVTRYLIAQVEAGAQCLQLFDSWAGCLSSDDYQRYVAPHVQSILRGLPAGVPIINFATGNPELLPWLKGDARTVVGVDWRIPLDVAWRRVGCETAVQGNLDPTVLLADRPEIERQVRAVLDQAAGRPGHIFNLGHGILPPTPVDNVRYLVDLVHELTAR
jgi:uroporphyrinogen decarboxylase